MNTILILEKKKNSYIIKINEKLPKSYCTRCKKTIEGVEFYQCKNKLCPIFLKGN